MREIALHLLDIAENSAAAGASRVCIEVCEDLEADVLSAEVHDNGRGMDADLLAQVVDPFVTSRTTRKVGLGIPLLKAAAEACEGSLSLASTPGEGTHLRVQFRRSHIDRMPLGDLPGTTLNLVVAYPDINWLFDYRAVLPGGADPQSFHFDDRPIKEAVGDLPLSEPDILTFLRCQLEEGAARIQNAITEAVQTLGD